MWDYGLPGGGLLAIKEISMQQNQQCFCGAFLGVINSENLFLICFSFKAKDCNAVLLS